MNTKINWSLHNHCTAGCSYCPSHYWQGTIENSFDRYLDVTNKIIKHYSELGRTIEWTFNGGEPLEMFDFPAILKLCKEHQGYITLHTNGGRLWLDWWAIEPHVDNLVLSYHYWQNPRLIDYIIEIFQKSNKQIEVIIPIRPNNYEEDMDRVKFVENKHNLTVNKLILFKEMSDAVGPYNYEDNQLEEISGPELVEEHVNYKETTYEERVETLVNQSPSFLGKKCNTGIERLFISHDGWASGSACNNTHLGNIWHEGFTLPNSPSVCKMLACTNGDDQTITKF